jgi:hypothetical protein
MSDHRFSCRRPPQGRTPGSVARKITGPATTNYAAGMSGHRFSCRRGAADHRQDRCAKNHRTPLHPHLSVMVGRDRHCDFHATA